MDRSVGSGSGLKAEYFDGQELKGKPVVTVAPQLAFRRRGWAGRFMQGRTGDKLGENYSCRWSGYVQAVKSEAYTLTLDVNAGGRLYFAGKLVIDAWDKPQTRSASGGKLQAGKKYPIKVEHRYGKFKETRTWKVHLYWESASTGKELIPPTQFYLPEGFVEP